MSQMRKKELKREGLGEEKIAETEPRRSTKGMKKTTREGCGEGKRRGMVIILKRHYCLQKEKRRKKSPIKENR